MLLTFEAARAALITHQRALGALALHLGACALCDDPALCEEGVLLDRAIPMEPGAEAVLLAWEGERRGYLPRLVAPGECGCVAGAPLGCSKYAPPTNGLAVHVACNCPCHRARAERAKYQSDRESGNSARVVSDKEAERDLIAELRNREPRV